MIHAAYSAKSSGSGYGPLFVPTLGVRDEPKLDADLVAVTRHQKSSSHARFISAIVSALSHRPGLGCIIAHGVYAFSTSADRMKRFIQRRPSPIAFIFIYGTESGSHRLAIAGFTDGILSDGRSLCCILGENFIASQPTMKESHNSSAVQRGTTLHDSDQINECQRSPDNVMQTHTWSISILKDLDPLKMRRAHVRRFSTYAIV